MEEQGEEIQGKAARERAGKRPKAKMGGGKTVGRGMAGTSEKLMGRMPGGVHGEGEEGLGRGGAGGAGAYRLGEGGGPEKGGEEGGEEACRGHRGEGRGGVRGTGRRTGRGRGGVLDLDPEEGGGGQEGGKGDGGGDREGGGDLVLGIEGTAEGMVGGGAGKSTEEEGGGMTGAVGMIGGRGRGEVVTTAMITGDVLGPEKGKTLACLCGSRDRGDLT